MADNSPPMPGRSEFSADEEKAMREAGRAALAKRMIRKMPDDPAAMWPQDSTFEERFDAVGELDQR